MSELVSEDSDTERKPSFTNLGLTCPQKNKRLTDSDFDLSCTDLAKFLLGKVLVRKIGNDYVKGKIVETECYPGFDDKASHSFNGRMTDRNAAMFMAPGTAYVYFTYGMYHCFNISSKGKGAAVLLRALEPTQGVELMESLRKSFRKNAKYTGMKELKNHELCNGPSKLCISFNIDKQCNMQNLCCWDEMWIEYGDVSHDTFTVISCPRIGIDSAGEEAASKDLRFYILGNPAVSKKNKNKEKDAIIFV